MADSWGRSVDMYLDTLYACMKMLRSGVTTVMFNLSPGAAAETPEDCEKALTAFGRWDEGELLGVRGEPVPHNR